MQSFHWSRGIVFIALLAIFTGSGAVSAQDHFMVPDRYASQLPAKSEVLHDYQRRLLVRVPEGSGEAVDQRYASALEDTRYLKYRSWRGLAQGNEPAELPEARDAYFVLALVGPLDPQWRAAITSHGLNIVDHVNPYGLVVRGDSAAVQNAAASLQTSRGYPVITQALLLPDSSRTAPRVAEWLTGRTGASELGFRQDNGQPLVRIVFHDDVDSSFGNELVAEFLEPGPDFVAKGSSGQYRASASALSTLLEQVPEVAYVHGVYPKELHNNIGPLEHITNIEPVWNDLGYIGTGLIAGINDSGVDEEHADFPPGTILATQGAMSGTDNGHGTHVSGTVAGRGAAPSPTNTSSCGDVSTPLPDARGMAHGAQIVHNNLFDGGIGDEAAMMEWQFQQGAVINNNSWGYSGFGGPATDYGAETVAVDAAVRQAEAGVESQMAIVFSAGNSASAGISKPGNGKNVITVGASQNDRCGSYVPDQCAGPDIDGMACFSSHGPTQGRNKPDIVAPGTDVLSTGSSDPEATWGGWDQAWTGEEYAIVPGTSMSAPMVTGAATVFMEAYQDLNGDLPSPALVKAALINTATDMGAGFPSNIQGWGRLNLRKAIEGPVEDGIVFFDQDEVDHLATSDSWMTEISVASADEPVRFSLVWTDPPGSAGCDPCHINDLDLIVTAPDGTVYRGNQFTGAWSEPDAAGRDEGNNVENVYVELPDSGKWQVEVNGFNVAELPPGLTGQDFALVATGDLGGLSIDPASAQVCTADGSTDFTLTLSGQFEGTTDLVASGLPAGTAGSFNPNPVVFPDEQSVFTLSDLGLASGGDYIIDFTATDAGDPTITADGSADLALYEAVPGQPNPLTPADTATDVDLQPVFTWDEPSEPFEYQIQVATDSGFTSVVIDETVAATEFIPADELATGTDFFWRVRSANACGDGAWSAVFEFQTRFEPIADITPESMTIEVAPDATADDILSISNTGTGNLVWEIGTDSIESAGVDLQSHDPSLDEAFDLPDFTVEGSTTPVPVEFNVDAGVLTRGDVVGFSFIGTAAGVSGTSGWASDTCMVLEAPDGTTFGVGGLSGSEAECDLNDWDFQGSGSGDDGTYESSHDAVFDPPVPDEGEWTIRFVNDWASDSAPDIAWSDVTVTLHKQPLPVCIEGEMTTVPWLSASPTSGSTAAGNTDDVTVTVDATGLSQGQYEGYLCVGSNSADGATMIPVPVVANVNDPNIAVLEGTVDTTGYCQANPGLVDGADVTVTGSTTTTYQTTTDGDGFYSIEIPISEDPVDITVGGAGYLDSSVTGVTLDGSGVVVEDFTLLADSPCATITPESFDFEVVLGDTDSDLLTFGNVDGNVDLEWSVDDFEAAAAAQNQRVVVLEEDFSDTTFPPTGWSQFLLSGTTSEQWHRDTAQSHTGPASATRGDVSGAQDDWLVTPSVTVPLNAQLTFHDRGNFMSFYGKNSVLISTGSCDPNDGEFVELLEVDDTPEDTWRSEPVVVDLGAYANDDACLAFRYEGDFAHEWWIDTVAVAEVPPSCENPNAVPWLSLTPATGITAPGDSDDVTVAVDTTGLADGDYEATICAATNDDNVSQVEIPVTMTVNDPVLGSLTGQVFSQTCSADPVPLGGAELTIEGSNGGVFTTQADASGNYFIKVHEDESPVDITATAADHVDQTASGIAFQGLDVITTDIVLPAVEPCAEVAPEILSIDLDAGDAVNGIVELSNVGYDRLDWTIDTGEGEFLGFERPDPNDALDADKRPSQSPVVISSGDVELTAADLQGLITADRGDGPTLSVESMTTGGAYDSGHPFNSNVTLDIGEGNALIGVGWEVTVETFSPSWLSESSVAFRSSPGGLEGINLAPGAGTDEAGTGTFSSEGVLLFEDAELDPIPAGDGGTLYLEWFESFVDHADDPDSIWSDSDAPLVLPPGLRLICEDQAACDQAILGVPEIDCDNPAGISWLNVNPAFGVTHVGETTDLNVSLDASGLQPGSYAAGLCVTSNDPVNPLLTVPVTLNVRLPGDWATVEGTVQSLGHCSSDPGALEGANIAVVGGGDTYSATTDASGSFQVQLPSGDGPVSVTATHPNHLEASESGVGLTAGASTIVDFDMTLDEACATVVPESIDDGVAFGSMAEYSLTIGNVDGAAGLNWDVFTDGAASADSSLADPQARVAPAGVRRAMPDVMPMGANLLEEGFEDGVIPPPDWLHFEDNSGFTWEIDDSNPQAGAFNGSVFFDEDLVPQDEWLLTPPMALDSGVLTFWSMGSIFWCRDDNDNCDLNIWIVTGDEPDAAEDIFVGTADDDWPDNFVWVQSSFDLTSLLPGGEVRIGFQYEGVDGAQASLDSVSLTGSVSALPCEATTAIPWLSVEPVSGSTAAGASSEVGVTVDGSQLDPGMNEAFVCVTTDDALASLFSVPVSIERLEGEIEVAPLGLSSALEVDSSDIQSFSIDNVGAGDLDWSIDNTGSCELPAWVEVAPMSGLVNPGDGSSVEVTFDSTGLAPGNYNGTVCVTSNDAVNGLVEVDLSLTVFELDPGVLELTPAAHNFGSVPIGSASTETLTLTNTAEAGSASVLVDNIELVGHADFADTGTGSCEAGVTELAVDESCTIEVSFTPSADGSVATTVLVDGADGKLATADLSGTGIEPTEVLFQDRFESQD